MRDIQGMQFVTTTSNAFVFDSNEETKINIDPNKEMYF
jgi:hypothetical protein